MSKIEELKKAIGIYEKRLEANRIAWEEVEKAENTLLLKKEELSDIDRKISSQNNILSSLIDRNDTLYQKHEEGRKNIKTLQEELDLLNIALNKSKKRLENNQQKEEQLEKDYKNYNVKISLQKQQLQEEIKNLKKSIDILNNNLILKKEEIISAEKKINTTNLKFVNINNEIALLKKDKKAIEDDLYNLSTKFIQCHN